jgi:hypothetical protein
MSERSLSSDSSHYSVKAVDNLRFTDVFDDQKSHDDDDDDDNSISFTDMFEQELLSVKDLPIQDLSSEECTRPVFFEGGMGFQECLAYYELRDAQHEGGMVRRVQRPLVRRSLTSSRGSILRQEQTSRRASKQTVRRFSFSGMPTAATNDDYSTESTNEDDSLQQPRRRVGFSQDVRIRTHPAITDYSPDTKAKLWVSREDIVSGMHVAQIAVALQRARALKDVARQQGNSFESVINECQMTVNAAALADL